MIKVHIRIDDGQGAGINKSYKMGEMMLDFRSVRDWIIVEGLDINAVRATIRVDDERGNAISTGYEWNEAMIFFLKYKIK